MPRRYTAFPRFPQVGFAFFGEVGIMTEPARTKGIVIVSGFLLPFAIGIGTPPITNRATKGLNPQWFLKRTYGHRTMGIA
jgi:hypothetical protein